MSFISTVTIPLSQYETLVKEIQRLKEEREYINKAMETMLGYQTEDLCNKYEKHKTNEQKFELLEALRTGAI